MKKIGLLYAPEGGSVEKVAKKINHIIGEDKIELISIQKNNDITIFDKFDKFIMGISTVGRDNWDAHYSKIGWDLFIPKMERVNLSGKTVAIFGLGNHILYPDNFVDSMGILAKKVTEKGAELVGQIPVDKYEYNDSAAVMNGKFFGVAIDEDNDPELTDERIEVWLKEIKNKFNI